MVIVTAILLDTLVGDVAFTECIGSEEWVVTSDMVVVSSDMVVVSSDMVLG
jgi:hypothetical protein